MAHAASMAADSTVLREHERLFRQAGRYIHAISKEEAAKNYTVGDGTSSISETLGRAFGVGNKGQTYVYERNDSFYESRMSFFSSLQGLDLTPGQSPAIPQNVHEAMGRLIDPTLRRCFGCHTTASTTRAGFDPSRLVLGADCEACHGPGARHAELIDEETNAEGRQAIFNRGNLGPVAQFDFLRGVSPYFVRRPEDQNTGRGERAFSAVSTGEQLLLGRWGCAPHLLKSASDSTRRLRRARCASQRATTVGNSD